MTRARPRLGPAPGPAWRCRARRKWRRRRPGFATSSCSATREAPPSASRCDGGAGSGCSTTPSPSIRRAPRSRSSIRRSGTGTATIRWRSSGRTSAASFPAGSRPPKASSGRRESASCCARRSAAARRRRPPRAGAATGLRSTSGEAAVCSPGSPIGTPTRPPPASRPPPPASAPAGRWRAPLPGASRCCAASLPKPSARRRRPLSPARAPSGRPTTTSIWRESRAVRRLPAAPARDRG
jgi:hypothetical protein